MLNDERPHVHAENEQACLAATEAWKTRLGPLLRNEDGSSLEIILARETIKSVRTAQELGEQFRRAGCRSVILCFNVWNFPYLVWPFVNSLGTDVALLTLANNEGAYPGNVGLLATDGALRQAGVRTHRIIGDPDDEGTVRSVVDWIRGAQAATAIRSQVYGLYGGHSMGMETGYFHLVPTVKTLGTNLSHIDQLWVVERMKTIHADEVRAGRQWLEMLLGDRLRYDRDVLTPELLETQLRLYRAIVELNEENGFDYCGIKGQRELTEYVCVADVAEMLLNDPYDWHGAKEVSVCATEADAFGAITMQLLKYLSGGLPSLFMDVRLYHADLDVWDLVNSGQHASWYAARSADPEANFAHITFHPALRYYFKAGGASVAFDAAPGPLTFARLGLWNERLYMVIARGEVVALPGDVRQKLNAQTDPTWPHVHARLQCAYADAVQVLPSNHLHATAGDVVARLAYTAEIAGIQPIVLGDEQRVTPIWDRIG